MAKDIITVEPMEIGARDRALDRLAPNELADYQKHCRSGAPDLSSDANKRLYGLFLRGIGIAEMVDLNPALSAGVIQKARIDGRWDERRDAYLSELLDGMSSQTQQVAAESLKFMLLQLQVAHQEYGAAMRKFLQTGNPADLGSFKIGNMRDYKTVIESIAKLMETGSKKSETAIVNVTASPGSNVEVSAASNVGNGTIGSSDAERLLAFLAEKKD